MMKRILGIDPGLLHTGWSIIEVAGSTRKYIASGVILPPVKIELSQRLVFIFNKITEICENFHPNECAIEVIFVNKNGKTTLLLAQARAAAVTAVALKDIPVFEYEPNKVKKTLTSAGHADKEQIYRMLSILLPNAKPKSPDESDAIAIAMTHANTSRF